MINTHSQSTDYHNASLQLITLSYNSEKKNHIKLHLLPVFQKPTHHDYIVLVTCILFTFDCRSNKTVSPPFSFVAPDFCFSPMSSGFASAAFDRMAFFVSFVIMFLFLTKETEGGSLFSFDASKTKNNYNFVNTYIEVELTFELNLTMCQHLISMKFTESIPFLTS